MNRMLKCQEGNANRARKFAAVPAVLALAAVFSASGVAFAATYDESTGYVKMTNAGKDGESPLNTNLVSKSSSDLTQVYAWSDGLAPHSNTNYYAYRMQFRSPKLNSGVFEFNGGRFLMERTTMWPKTFSPAILSFPRGLELMDAAVIQINDGGTKSVIIDGPVTFSGATTNYPAKNANDNSSILFIGDASSPADVTVAVLQKSSSIWGWFGLLGDTTGFLGTVAVESCGYEVGTRGLPNGTVAFTGTNNVLRLIANPAATAPIMKTLRFDSEGPHEISVAVDGADYGKVRVTNDFSAAGPISISLSGTVSDLGNARRFEFLRVPGGSLAGVDLRLASLTAGDYTLYLSFEKDGDEDVVAIEAHKRVTMQYGGDTGDSPLSEAQVKSSGNLVYAWSDNNAPMDPTLCYYDNLKQFRTPATSLEDFEFAGGRFFCTNCTMLLKTYSSAVLRFPRGLEIMDNTTVRLNDTACRTSIIDGPVTFSGTSYVNPAGGNNVEESCVSFLGDARSRRDANVVVRQQSATRRGFFSLAGGTDGFLGKITVNSCNYLMGTNGLPNGTLSFVGTNDVLRLPAVSSGMTPAVKTLTFGDDGPATLEVVCDGADHGAVRVTGTISAERPLSVVLTGNVEQPEGGASLLPVLRAPAGQLSLSSFSLAQDKIGSLAVEWFIAEEAGEQVLVAKVAVRSTVIIMR